MALFRKIKIHLTESRNSREAGDWKKELLISLIVNTTWIIHFSNTVEVIHVYIINTKTII